MVRVLVVVTILAACSGVNHGLGDPCVEGTTVFPCDDGLYCSFNSQACVPLGQLGEACDPACSWDDPCDTFCDDAQGLFCGADDTCQLPGAAGARCRGNGECVADLLCNQGYVPEDPHLGQCQPPSTVGQPCFYRTYDGTAASFGVGCAPALVCVPPTETRHLIDAFPSNSLCSPTQIATGACGYAGVCQEPHTAAMGEG